MKPIKLSLCIPTYNRVDYLRELMPLLLCDVARVNLDKQQMEVVISNNASTDETEDYLSSLSCAALVYHRNQTNIGGDRNFLECVSLAKGEYIWLFGDDELIESGGISRVLENLERVAPSLLILLDRPNPLSVSYNNYGECLHREMKTAELFPLFHTLITSNVFRKDCFDMDVACARLYTNYGHMYGVMARLRKGGTVAILNGVVHIRPQRARLARWPFALCVKQAIYLWRLAGWFGAPRLYGHALRAGANLPVEIAACLMHWLFPKFRRT